MRIGLFGSWMVLGLTVGCTDPIELEDGDSGDPQTGDTGSPTTTSGPTTTTTGPMTTTESTVSTVTTMGPSSVSISVTADDGTDTFGLPDCPGVGEGPLLIGEPCSDNADCESALCLLYNDRPTNVDAICEFPEPDCSMRITGTVLDIVTQQPVPGAEVVVASALQAATNPQGATPLTMAISEGDGRVDTVSLGPVDEPIGIVSLVESPGYVLTITGLAAPYDGATAHGVGNDTHDLWIVTEVALATWSGTLALDPEVDPTALPLGDSGGMVGITRDGGGAPLAGISLSSTAGGGSEAVIRYLNPDGSFNPDATTELGLFVILSPGLAEQFEASAGGMVLAEITALSAPGAISTVSVHE